jgi:hypothetical protein
MNAKEQLKLSILIPTTRNPEYGEWRMEVETCNNFTIWQFAL